MTTKNKARYFYTVLAAGLLSATSFASAANAATAVRAAGGAYVINGSTVAACPANALCLYADIRYNGTGERTKILVIPSGVSAGNFGDYGFDYSSNGVSSIVNKTGHETGLVSGLQLAGQVLRIPAGSNIPSLVDIRLGAGNWNDAPRSAISARVVAADLSVHVRGPAEAVQGAAVAYEVDIANDGPDAVPAAIVNLDIPGALDAVSISCTSATGSCGKTDETEPFQALVMKNNGRATITVEGTVLPDFKGVFIVGAAVKSPGVINTASRTADTQRTAVTQRPVVADLALSMHGSNKATPGAQVAYTMEVDNHGPDAVPDAILAIDIPDALEARSVTCTSATASCGATAADGSSQALNMKKGGHAKVVLAATVASAYTGTLSVGATLKSPGVVNTAPVYYGNVATAVKKNVVKNLEASDVLAGSWGDWESGGQIYSYRLTMTAARDDVRKWTISFDGLPEGVRIYNKNVLWTEIVKDGSDGQIILGTPENGVHVVAAGKPLNIDLQLLYPKKDDAYNRLENLTATQRQ